MTSWMLQLALQSWSGLCLIAFFTLPTLVLHQFTRPVRLLKRGKFLDVSKVAFRHPGGIVPFLPYLRSFTFLPTNKASFHISQTQIRGSLRSQSAVIFLGLRLRKQSPAQHQLGPGL